MNKIFLILLNYEYDILKLISYEYNLPIYNI